jgi:serine/threonine-protein kinase
MSAGRTSDATRLAPGDRGHLFPTPAGAGGDFVYVAALANGRRVARLVTSEGSRDLGETTGQARIVGGYLLRARDGVLVAQRFDPETKMPVGRTTALAPRVGISPSGHAMYAASERLLVFSEGAERLRDLIWRDLATGTTTRMSDPRDYWQIRLSPDDRFAAVTTLDPLIRTLDVLIVPTGGTGDAQPLTRSVAGDTDPVWSPDGQRVLFRSLQDGAPRLFARAVGVRGAPDEPVSGSEAGDLATDWIPGRVLLQAEQTASGVNIWELDLAAGRRRPILEDGFDETDARYSPDRRSLAYVSDESGRPDVYVRAASAVDPRVRVSFAGGSRPRWSRDGRSLFFARGSRIMRADRADGAPGRFTAPQDVMEAAGLRDFDVAHESGRLAVLVQAPGGDTLSASALIDWRTSLEAGR